MGLLYLPEQQIPDYDPNSNEGAWAHDKFGRRELVEPLKRLILAEPDAALTLAINSDWGTGKTWFLKMWQRDLLSGETPRPCVYFNAWSTDFADDPLIAFVESITTQLLNIVGESEEYNEIREHISHIKKKAFPTAIAFIKTIGKSFGADIDAIADALRGVHEEYDIVENFKKKLEHIEEFKASLSSTIKKMDEKGLTLPLIVFIDELDRCRPDYAIQFLERIKHIFSIKGIIFVIAIAKSQLVQSACSQYGFDQDNAHHYLKRFIDIEYDLPSPEPKGFINHLFKESGIGDQYQEPLLPGYILSLCKLYDVKPRGIIQFFTQFSAVAKAYCPTIHKLFLIAGLIIVKIQYKDKYKEIMDRNFDGWHNKHRVRDVQIGIKTLDKLDHPYNILMEVTIKKIGMTQADYQNSIIQDINKQIDKNNSAGQSIEMLQLKLKYAERVKHERIKQKEIRSMVEFATAFTKSSWSV